MIKPYIEWLREEHLKVNPEKHLLNIEIQVIALSRMCDAIATELNKREEERKEENYG